MKKTKSITGIIIAIILFITVLHVLFIPNINQMAQQRNEQMEIDNQIARDTTLTDSAYQKAFELYYLVKKQDDPSVTIPSLYLKGSETLEDDYQKELTAAILENNQNSIPYSQFQYYVIDQDTDTTITNTSGSLTTKTPNYDDLLNEYEWFIEIYFDNSGIPVVNNSASSNSKVASTQNYYNAFNATFSRNFQIENTPINSSFIFNDVAYEYQAIKNTTFRFAVPLGYTDNYVGYSYTFYPDGQMFELFLVLGLALAICTGFLFLKQKDAALLGFPPMNETDTTHVTLRDFPIEIVMLADLCALGVTTGLGHLASSIVPAFITLFILYLFFVYNLYYYLMLLKKKDFKKHSMCVMIWNYTKKSRKKFYDYALHLDMSSHDNTRLLIIIFLNLIILFFIAITFYDAVSILLALIAYSAILFFFLRKYISDINFDYHKLLDVIRNIAIGKTNDHIDDNLGIFEPFKPELKEIQTNFETAIAEEVRSQQMKTELITNVSHDLKTPLTSLISYIDLLKKEDISDAERKKYIDILEKSSARLKNLVENLFEVSKANSGNVSLDFMKVDIVSLMKQVQVECEDAIKKRKLTIRNAFSDEKIVLLLDSQKTYRIFENLISNICKYTLKGTRVYVDIKNYDSFVEISMKNISAQELNFDADEITERFMRGDKSRNTEGSGLGLAIVKSFTELQHGTLKIQTDGDLFKVFIRFPITDESKEEADETKEKD